jgi:hypothetical protein
MDVSSLGELDDLEVRLEQSKVRGRKSAENAISMRD